MLGLIYLYSIPCLVINNTPHPCFNLQCLSYNFNAKHQFFERTTKPWNLYSWYFASNHWHLPSDPSQEYSSTQLTMNVFGKSYYIWSVLSKLHFQSNKPFIHEQLQPCQCMTPTHVFKNWYLKVWTIHRILLFTLGAEMSCYVGSSFYLLDVRIFSKH
jgi:hypothetical protein